MSDNRWGPELSQHEDLINSIGSPHRQLASIAAHEINLAGFGDGRLLEIGCGKGVSTRPILETTKCFVTAIDTEVTAIEAARINLREFDRARFYVADALLYLANCTYFPAIFSSWTLHNFRKLEQVMLFDLAYQRLQKGGMFVVDDYIADRDDEELLREQVYQYARYLPEDVAPLAIEHIKKDATNEYRMDEDWLIKVLGEVGFSTIHLVDRIKREALVIAHK